MNLPVDASATIYNEMISYSDYNGPQNDMIVRDGDVVPFDRDAARATAHHAHMLAIDVPEQAGSAAPAPSPVAVHEPAVAVRA